MGFFSGLKSTWKKSEAAVVVQNLLEHQAKVGHLENADAQQLANRLIGVVWEQKSDIFEGKFGQRPHKISVAAIALANGLEQLARDDRNRAALFMSLGTVLAEIETNGQLYGLTAGVDQSLIEVAATVFAIEAKRLAPALQRFARDSA